MPGITGITTGRVYGTEKIYRVEVDQEDGNIFIYEVTESDLDWLNRTNKSKWEVKNIGQLVDMRDAKKNSVTF